MEFTSCERARSPPFSLSVSLPLFPKSDASVASDVASGRKQVASRSQASQASGDRRKKRSQVASDAQKEALRSQTSARSTRQLIDKSEMSRIPAGSCQVVGEIKFSLKIYRSKKSPKKERKKAAPSPRDRQRSPAVLVEYSQRSPHRCQRQKFLNTKEKEEQKGGKARLFEDWDAGR